MPTQMVGVGGARPTQELGQEFNTQMTNNILRVAQEVSQENIAKTKSKQIIEGKARVAQGESLESIRASQGIFDKIFGAGTIEGAKAQTIIQATDQHVLHMTTNMGKYKHQTTEEFVAAQNEYVSENLITGDPEVDNFITLASAEAIADSTAIHAKAHAMYVQEQNKVAFETTLQGSSKRINALMKDPSIDLLDKISGVKSLQDRMQRMPGQTQEAYMASVADVMISELKADRPEMYQGLMQGGYQIGDTIVETGAPLQFDPSTSTKINEAFNSYEGRANVSMQMDKSLGFADLKKNSLNMTINDEELSGMVQMYLGKHGADALTMTQISSLFTERGAHRLKETKKQQGVLDIATGASRTNTDRNKVANDLNLYEAKLQETVAKLPADQQEQAVQAAAADMLQKVLDNDIVPSSWEAQWNNGFASLVDKDGKASPAFIRTLQHFNARYPSRPELFSEAFKSNPAALTKALGVKNLMQTEGVSIEEALVQYNSNILSTKEAMEVANTKVFRKKLDNFIGELDPPWYKFGFGDEWAGIKNLPQVRSGMKQYMIDSVAKSGDIGDGAMLAAGVRYKRTHERVGDYIFPNYGTPLRVQAGITSPEVSFDDALTHYLYNKGELKFGAGFDPQNVQLNFQPGYIMITPVNPDGTYISGIPGSGRRVPLKAIGNIYNAEVLNPVLKTHVSKREARFAESPISP